MSAQPQTIFFLGATGYLGSQFLLLLNSKLPDLHVIALVRNLTPERKEQLQNVYSNISFVEGTLDDDAIIQEQVAKADITINCASSDHNASVKSTLAGLETGSKNHPGKPPLYIHVSGCGIVSDNARGEPVEYVKEWSDIGLDLKQCDQTNTHLDSDIPIVEAGSRTENPVRTIIYFPAQIYGLGQGVQKTTLWLRIFLDMMKKLGFAGTWGPGANAMNNIHVKDCAMGLYLVLNAALEGKADEGPEGLYFAASSEPRMTYHAWTKVMGDYLHSKGIIKEGGSRPMPPEVVDPLGHYGWSLLGGNQFVKAERLARLGWEPVETKKLPLLESFPDALDEALKE
ncbi:hypothetical protein HYDPIDRAFT_114722 [Hydnomerulius pinastri MD-312]|uniref:Unplaced genomic scaffold scaffold_22, whole genome shotgun sequence n=1 Tax=Hydnomerulius pinastri MD-312 TaxID=994086 RepID=A0A0C9VVT8_9AGAM|nr:hypothetical protein HYDPIDRAFT_114722 [Hydnomerulius pinastri MD-312]